MPITIRILSITSLCLGAACSRAGPRTDSAATRTAQPSSPDRRADWVITPRGLGPLRAGMTRAQAEAIVGGSLAIDGDGDWKGCAYTPADLLPPGARMMVEDGTIARIDITDTTISTAEGARIGDSEDRIRQLYRGRVFTTPHKYTDGHYLTVKSTGDADSLFRIVFETDSGRVKRFRAGRIPPVEYVEGCG